VNAFRDFELEALSLLLREALTPEQFRLVATFSGATAYRYTGSGYCLTISNQILPIDKLTCSTPAVVGQSGDVQSGFVAFLGNQRLTLEWHTRGPVDVPTDFRDRAVVISTPPVRIIKGPHPLLN
jgi:hypothetical protein